MRAVLVLFVILTLCFNAVGREGIEKKIKLIPNPKSVDFPGGNVGLGNSWVVCSETGSEDDLYAAEIIIDEAKDCFNWTWKIADPLPEKNYIVLREMKASEDDPDLFKTQGYLLTIRPEKIVIEAPTAAGRFYGAQTLRQIFRNAYKGAIPEIDIRDWPSLKWRGISDDISRGQVSTIENFKSIVRRLAFYKKNLYQPYIEDMFRFEADPDIGRTRGAITKKEMKMLLDEAKKHHITLTPVFESLGHQDRLLSLPENRKYAEVQDPGEKPWSFSPVSDEAYEFVTNLIGEVAAATPDSPFFHIGGDESWDVGKGTSKQKVEEVGVGRVHADYFSRLNEFVNDKLNRRMMQYADMINRHPEAMEHMPKNIIMIDWHYSTKSDFETADKLKEAGFNVMTSPGIWSWADYYPNLSWATTNIAKAARKAKELNLMGCITSSWGDRGAENLRENNWPGYAYSASATWEVEEADPDRFLRRFCAIHFGVDNEEFPEAFKKLGWYDYLGTAYIASLFHNEPKITLRSREELDNMIRLHKEMQEVIRVTGEYEDDFRFHPDYPEIIDHVARRNIYLARREMSLNEIAKSLGMEESGNLPEKKQKKILMDLEGLRNDLANIWDEYPGLWLKYYKYPRLDYNMERLSGQVEKLQGFVVKAQRGELTAIRPPRGVWMWYPDPDPQKESGEGERYFIRTVDLPAEPVLAVAKCWADDKASLFVNGAEIFEVTYYDDPKSKEVTNNVNRGKNFIAIEAENEIGAGGLLFEMEVQFADGTRMFLSGDDEWRVTDKASENWMTSESEGENWMEPKLLGKGLIKPWNHIDW